MVLSSCNSAKTNEDYTFDDISSSEFKVNEEDLDVYIPYVRILELEDPKGVEDNVINHFFKNFKDFYSIEEFYIFPEFRNNNILGDKILDSLKNNLAMPKLLVKHINQEKKYSLISSFNAYSPKHKIDYSLYIYDNKTLEKVYYHHSKRPINFDSGKGLEEHKKEIFTRFLKR